MFDPILKNEFIDLSNSQFIAGFEFAQFMIGVNFHLVPFNSISEKKYEKPSFDLAYYSIFTLHILEIQAIFQRVGWVVTLEFYYT